MESQITNIESMDENYKSSQKIINLIKLHLQGQSNEVEEAQLLLWLQENEENRKLYLRIKSASVISEKQKQRNLIDVEADWNKIANHINPEINQKFQWKFFLQVAAVIAVVLSVALGLLYNNYKGNQIFMVQSTNNKPINKEVILTLSNGQEVTLGHKEYKNITTENGVSLKDSVGNLIYQAQKQAHKQKAKMNTITIPTGGEYRLTLSDNTVIYLNSESEVRFPDYFEKDIRKIELKGEAYLKVAKDANRPFIVQMEDAQVKVLGTEFNLRSYADESYTYATLAEGSIEVSTPHESVIIKPGEQASLSNKTKIRVKEVNVDNVVSWVHGEYIFNNERLEDVLGNVSRWYDVDFAFSESEIKDYRFTGRVRKKNNLEKTLSIIERTEVVTFNIENNKINVSGQ